MADEIQKIDVLEEQHNMTQSNNQKGRSQTEGKCYYQRKEDSIEC